MRSSVIKCERGMILPVIFLVMGAISVIVGVIVTYLTRMHAQAIDADTQVEAQMLASDIKELGKYLLLYEKVHFRDRPLRLNPARRQAMTALWSQEFGHISVGTDGHSLANSCGGYSALVVFIGDLRLGGEPVFCPSYLRNSQLTGRLLERMILEKWANPGAETTVLHGMELRVTTMADVVHSSRTGRGAYEVKLDLSGGGTDWLNDPENFILMSFGQKIARRLEQLKVEADLSFEILTDGQGFVPGASERFVKIKSRVAFKGSSRFGEFSDHESFVIVVPTVKDFAIFLPYPTRLDGAPTRRFSEAVRLGPGSVVHGRVFFNGDIDTPLDSLPEFTETVFISGSVTSITDASQIELAREKFRKGVVTHFSAPRFLLSGSCAEGSTGKVNITNVNGFYCERDGEPFWIRDYVDALNGDNQCPFGEARVTPSGGVELIPQPGFNGSIEMCSDPSKVAFVKGGFHNVTVNGAFAFIATPVSRLTIQGSQSSIYGTILGGHIEAPGGVRFYSLSALRPGLPGIGSAASLAERSMEANGIYEGIGVPLSNFPLIQSARDGAN